MTDRHLIEVTVYDADTRHYRVVCPDGGANCECWTECQQTHLCDCGPHDSEDDALECDEWLWRDGVLHGEFHQYVGSLVCVEDTGCWMTDWSIEFDQIDYRDRYPAGLYEFDYDEPDQDEGGLLYVTTMHPVDAR